jgi:flagellar hook-length control protein FliK
MNSLPPMNLPSAVLNRLLQGMAVGDSDDGGGSAEAFREQFAQRISQLQESGKGPGVLLLTLGMMPEGQAGESLARQLDGSSLPGTGETSPLLVLQDSMIEGGDVMSSSPVPPATMEPISLADLPGLELPITDASWQAALAQTIREAFHAGVGAARLPMQPESHGDLFVGFAATANGLELGLISEDEQVRGQLLSGLPLLVDTLQGESESPVSIVMGALPAFAERGDLERSTSGFESDGSHLAQYVAQLPEGLSLASTSAEEESGLDWDRPLDQALRAAVDANPGAAALIVSPDGEPLLEWNMASEGREWLFLTDRPEVRDAVLRILPALQERGLAQGLPVETVSLRLVSRVDGGLPGESSALASGVVGSASTSLPSPASTGLSAFLDAVRLAAVRGVSSTLESGLGASVGPSAGPWLGSWEGLGGSLAELLSRRAAASSSPTGPLTGESAEASAVRAGSTRTGSETAGVVVSASGLVAGVAQATQTASVARSVPLEVPFQQRDWDQALGQRIQWLVRENVQEARIRLNPREMGVIDIRIQVDGDRAHLQFVSAQANVREALDAALPRLREMFAEGGIALGDVSVGRENPGGKGSSGEQASREGRGKDDADAQANEQVLRQSPLERSLLDLYA